MTDLAPRCRRASAALADRFTTPIAVLDAFVARIERLNPSINALLHLHLDAARGEALASTARWQEGRSLSTIDGVPFGVKANIAVAGLPLHGGIGAYRNRITERDAAAVAMLKRAGAIPLGVINMHEGALGATTDNPHFGRCNNPWNENLTPGGSSGGSAAAVAARLCSFALGTDTMGSVRIPSTYCGIAGIKPTKNLISGEGLMDLSPTLDHVGVHAPSAADLAPIMSLFGVEYAARPAGRIGIARWGNAVRLESDVAEAFQAASLQLRSIKTCVEVDVSRFDFSSLRRAGLLISEIEGHRVHRDAMGSDRSGFSAEFAAMLDWGARQAAMKVAEASVDPRRRGAVRYALQQADVIVMPTAPQGPFAFGGTVPANQADFTCIANFGGLPSVAVPAVASGSPPPSLQFVAPAGKDAVALGGALAFERARGQAPPDRS